MIARRSLAVGVVPFLALALAGCPKKTDTAADAGPADAAVAVVDAGPAPLATPSNEAQVARFGDEAKLANVDAKISAPHANARESVPGGAVVASLKTGTAVVELAQHGKFVLVSFDDPKDATKRLEGWVGEDVFKAAGTVLPPVKGSCPGKQVHLVVDDQFFCGDICKVDKDCPNSEKCTGKANAYVDGKQGAEVSTCTVVAGADADAGAAPVAVVDAGPPAPAAGPTIKDVQQPAGADGKCAAGYTMANDKMCHKACPKGPADCTNAQSRCTAKVTADGTGVCISTAK